MADVGRLVRAASTPAGRDRRSARGTSQGRAQNPGRLRTVLTPILPSQAPGTEPPRTAIAFGAVALGLRPGGPKGLAAGRAGVVSARYEATTDPRCSRHVCRRQPLQRQRKSVGFTPDPESLAATRRRVLLVRVPGRTSSSSIASIAGWPWAGIPTHSLLRGHRGGAPAGDVAGVPAGRGVGLRDRVAAGSRPEPLPVAPGALPNTPQASIV